MPLREVSKKIIDFSDWTLTGSAKSDGIIEPYYSRNLTFDVVDGVTIGSTSET